MGSHTESSAYIVALSENVNEYIIQTWLMRRELKKKGGGGRRGEVGSLSERMHLITDPSRYILSGYLGE